MMLLAKMWQNQPLRWACEMLWQGPSEESPEEVPSVRRAHQAGRAPSLQPCLEQHSLLLPDNLECWGLGAPCMHVATF